MRLRHLLALAGLAAVAACSDTPTEQPVQAPELRLEIRGDSLDFGGFGTLNSDPPPILPTCSDSLPPGTECRGGGMTGSGG